MSKPKLNGKSRYKQGLFTPLNPEKYMIPDKIDNIIYRSSWEKRFCLWADTTKSVKKWSSESVVIPYRWSVDKKEHRYYVDFYAEIEDRYGEITKYLREVKPKSETQEPKKPSKITETYKRAVLTYTKNKDKWKAANLMCKQRGWKFIILTEDELLPPRKRR